MAEFKTIPEYPNYKINNRGDVKNQDGYFMSHDTSNQDYHRVHLSNSQGDKKKSIHRLVYQMFGDHSDLMKNYIIEHEDGKPWNNNISNLRLGNGTQNNYNTKKQKNSHSIFKGVCYQKIGARHWRSMIQLPSKKLKNLGSFHYEYNAGLAYDLIARHIHGEYYRNRNFNEYEGEIPESDEGARAKAETIINSL